MLMMFQSFSIKKLWLTWKLCKLQTWRTSYATLQTRSPSSAFIVVVVVVNCCCCLLELLELHPKLNSTHFQLANSCEYHHTCRRNPEAFLVFTTFMWLGFHFCWTVSDHRYEESSKQYETIYLQSKKREREKEKVAPTGDDEDLSLLKRSNLAFLRASPEINLKLGLRLHQLKLTKVSCYH